MTEKRTASIKVQRDDTVVVIAGKHKGKTGKVLRVLTDRSRVIVEKINLVRRNVKPKGDKPGGVVEKEASIHVSNVAVWNAAEGRRVRIGWKRDENGERQRVDRKTGTVVESKVR